MAAESSISQTKETSPEANFNRSALIQWESKEELENTIAPYVSSVIKKSIYGGYKSASQVFEDYKTFNALLKKLVDRKHKLLVERYVEEYIYRYAVWINAKMLDEFATLLLETGNAPTLQKEHKDWIRDHIVRVKFKMERLLSDSLGFFDGVWEKMLNQLDKDAQREVDKQKDEKTIHFQKYLTELELNNVEQKITEFEELESEISRMKNERLLRARHYTIYYKTLTGVEDQFNRLEMAFIKLLPKGENDLAKKWYFEKIRKQEYKRNIGMHEL